jgi:hypothetical protein
MNMTKKIVAAGSLLLVFGCSGGGSDSTEMPNESRVPDDHVFSDQVKALEKAESVENTLLKSKAERDKAIEEQAR